jgi:hypothetical protein
MLPLRRRFGKTEKRRAVHCATRNFSPLIGVRSKKVPRAGKRGAKDLK